MIAFLLAFQSLLAPVMPADTVRFGVVGDNQNGPAIFSQLVQQMRVAGIDVLVGLGDHIQNRSLPQEWAPLWLQPLAPIANVPRRGVIGNHCDPTGFPLFVNPTLAPRLPGGVGFWGAETIGLVRWLWLDSNQETLELRLSMATGGPQRAFLEAEVASPAWRSARWRIAAWHAPADTELWTGMSPCYYERTSVEHAPWVWAMNRLSAAGCHMVANGHAHGRQRGLWNGMLWIVSGGGGGALDHQCRDLPEITVASASHHFVLLTVTQEQMLVQAIGVTGVVLDSTSVR